MPDRIAFVQRGQLPRTTSGKIRRGAVREMLARNQLPVIAWFPGATGLALDRAATEDAIVEAAAALLGVETVDRSIPFAALGMNSLSSMRLRGRLAARFGERTPPTQAMLGHSVRTLALRIAATEGAALTAVPTTDNSRIRPILVTHATAADPAALNLAVLIRPVTACRKKKSLARYALSSVGILNSLRSPALNGRGRKLAYPGTKP